MGYDLMGDNAHHPTGGYFRANIWGWSNFRKLMAQADPDGKAFNAKDWGSIGDNSGSHVPRTRCIKMAKAIKKYVRAAPESDTDIVIEHITQDFKIKRYIIGFEVAGDPGVPPGEGYNSVETRDARIKEYITFLETCGGFRCC